MPNVTASVTDNETDFVTLVVVTKEERPYVMLNKGRKGNDAYDGFSIDLLKVMFLSVAISKRTGPDLIKIFWRSLTLLQNFKPIRKE